MLNNKEQRNYLSHIEVLYVCLMFPLLNSSVECRMSETCTTTSNRFLFEH